MTKISHRGRTLYLVNLHPFCYSTIARGQIGVKIVHPTMQAVPDKHHYYYRP